jgi:hypothetical protein
VRSLFLCRFASTSWQSENFSVDFCVDVPCVTVVDEKGKVSWTGIIRTVIRADFLVAFNTRRRCTMDWDGSKSAAVLNDEFAAQRESSYIRWVRRMEQMAGKIVPDSPCPAFPQSGLRTVDGSSRSGGKLA